MSDSTGPSCTRTALTVTAEGVETAAQADWLRTVGCDTVQGWHFSVPLTAAELRRTLTSG